jgi:hypothetical protein
MDDTMPDEFWHGVEQFNSAQFYACHDTLEALWIESTESDKNFYQGILQIAVALHHLENRNWRGAVILLGEGSNRLRRYPENYGGIDVDDFFSQAVELLKILQKIGPEKITEGNLDGAEVLLMPRIIVISNT